MRSRIIIVSRFKISVNLFRLLVIISLIPIILFPISLVIIRIIIISPIIISPIIFARIMINIHIIVWILIFKGGFLLCFFQLSIWVTGPFPLGPQDLLQDDVLLLDQGLLLLHQPHELIILCLFCSTGFERSVRSISSERSVCYA